MGLKSLVILTRNNLTRILKILQKFQELMDRLIYISICQKQDWRCRFSQKMNKQICLVCFLLFTANKTNSLVHFLGESTARQTCFWFYLIDSQEFQTFQRLCMLQQCSVPFECCNCHPLQCLMQLLDSPSSLPWHPVQMLFLYFTNMSFARSR